ncbi:MULTISPECIES: prephenate dehydrogenase [unclassified Undibacterium]|uniref:prephenate dehydrogenase n=1 Tax=unclassified Undibacterium TaxID=2630295 RepID=UPI002AC8DB93|nr:MULTISPECIES: prephenate dehydrogenase/arogenate dehydrogenase family protein [unclassified Undibacterium]MEB0139555.1 prephenate dehydrogenase/arogenate dehydrogenase family protein [Undibacterium sp. CCC2.1]MEB0172514.1 prephenate dehydrogenase/arogenate dehydrogenase family protein [Undibacterium sp. CCC1.1]MEB0176532.1 prephenate dehydrogenase/arogenate dehydrogenase family protein [Undibacterium sp. CCC3.4]MEB0215614.1 prephenate dehydrogenase/arogenate dehydrogenase family protein [Und
MQTGFQKIAIFGVGLIGGSFALALKQAGAVAHIVGAGRSRASLQTALELGIIDSIADSPAQAVRDADLVLIAAPVAQTEAILASIAPFLAPTTIVTDAGSTKSDVVAAARAALGERIGQFVPAHPIAGRELNGPQAALSDLYRGKKAVITALAENRPADVARVAAAWQQCGAIIHYLDPSTHDTVFAAVSHLPHLLAYALVDDIAKKPHADTLFQYAASGFRDFTRIAGSSPEMWRDISLANRSALLAELDSYMSNLQALRGHLLQADGAAINAVYANAQSARHNWISAIEAAEQQRAGGGD